MMKYLLPLAFVLLLAVDPAMASDRNVVTLRDQAFVSGEYTLLKDIADITGPDRDELSSIRIVRSPAGPLGITLSSAFISGKITECRKVPVTVNGSSSVQVCERYVEISGRELEGVYRDGVLRGSPWRDAGSIVIEEVRVPRNFRVPEKDRGRIQAKFSPREDFLGYTAATICAGSGLSAASCQVSGKVRVIAEVPVARTSIPRGTVLAESDLDVRSLDISSYPQVVPEKKGCLGMRTRSALREGRPVLMTNIERPPLVGRGDPVFIEARSGSLVVRDRGVALKDGFLKDRIPVKNAASGRQVFGTVIAASRIEVMF